MSTVPARPELTRSAFEVLLALQAGAAHGYAVMRFVEQITDGAVADGLVEETGTADPDAPHDARRRYYRLTAMGRELAAQEARLLASLLSAAADAGLLSVGDAR